MAMKEREKAMQKVVLQIFVPQHRRLEMMGTECVYIYITAICDSCNELRV
jgi:hypothetical protein